MDPQDAASARAAKVELKKERKKTRCMKESLKAKKRGRMLLRKGKDRMPAEEKAKEKLIADFLEAVGNDKNFAAEAMKSAVEAFISPEDAFKINLDELMVGSDTGVDINRLGNTRNLDKDGAVMAATEGKKVDGE